MKRKTICMLVTLLLALTACSMEQSDTSPSESVQEPDLPSTEEADTPDLAEAADEQLTDVDTEAKSVFEGPTTSEYIRQIVQDSVARFEQPGMSEYEKVKAAFDYMIEIGYYRRPIALDVWRWRSAGDTMPSYVEARGSYILEFGFGTCEDYAAALILLLEEMGIETRYMTGQTYTRAGGLALHSWIQAKVDGVWYHLDCELEDGISESGTVVYRYFMKGDSTMSASHFWGQRLIDSGALTEGQNEAVRLEYMGEDCPQDYPVPSPNRIAANPAPDVETLRAALLEELRAYEALHGELAYMDLDILPPVFVRYWYEQEPESIGDQNEFVTGYRQERSLIARWKNPLDPALV